MNQLCTYPPCKCLVPDDDLYCDDVCAMLAGNVVRTVKVSTNVQEDIERDAVPRCACGHPACGDSPVSAKSH